MSEKRLYIRRDCNPFVEAMYLTEENYTEVCAWMGYDEFELVGDDRVYFSKNNRNSEYRVTFGNWIVNKSQTMSDERFINEYTSIEEVKGGNL